MIYPAPPLPPKLVEHMAMIRAHLTECQVFINDSDFGLAKESLAKITRLVTLSYTVCDGLDKKRNHA